MTVPELSGVGRFNPSNIDKLVENVEAQGAGTAAYDLDLNLAVLKLYVCGNGLGLDGLDGFGIGVLNVVPHPEFAATSSTRRSSTWT